MLKFAPEPIASMQARYQDAILPVCDVERVQSGDQQPPAFFRRHVFDFQDGTRLIISRDRLDADDDPVIHVSGSPQMPPARNSLIEFMSRHGEEAARKWWRKHVVRCFREICGDKRAQLSYLDDGSRGVPHFLVVRDK